MDDDELLKLLGASLDPGERQLPPDRLAQLRSRVTAAGPAGSAAGPARVPGAAGLPGATGLPAASGVPGAADVSGPSGVAAAAARPRPVDVGAGTGWRWRWRWLAAAAAVVALFFAGGVLVGRSTDSDGGSGEVAAGVVEFDGPLRAAGGRVGAELVVRLTGTGRVVSFRSDALPILPRGEYYELWFVAPDDTAARPDRISAGTFHPDENGRSFVEFHGAFDPALYPGISVTAEPGDGDPARTGPEVLTGRIG